MAQVTGWTGKMMRVNLTKGTIKTLPTSKYQKYIGGAGIGYKVIFDEVPQGTKAYDEANKIVIATGPLTGTGAPLSGRTTVVSLSPMSPYHVVTDGHVGGTIGPMLKYAGWDAIIIEGASDIPVWLRIEDDKVTIEDATHVWGKGTLQTSYELSQIMGKDASISCIGQAGENLVPSSSLVNDISHMAGGHGGVFGSKKLKAIGIKGTQPVTIAAGKNGAWLELNRFVLSDIIGANNNHVVPSTQQSWNEFVWAGSRWKAREGLIWGESNPKVDMGECPPGNVNKVALRTQKAELFWGDEGNKRVIKNGGCHSCPIRCNPNLHVPELEKYGLAPYADSACINFVLPGNIMFKGFAGDDGKLPAATKKNELIGRALGARLGADYGIWSNYGQLGMDLKYCYESGTLKKVLPADEYASIPWDLLEKGDPAFLLEFFKRVALRIGEFSHIGDGAANIHKRWNTGEEHGDYEYTTWTLKFGYPKHHHEAAAQVAALVNISKNRDPNNHSLMNFWQNGLPLEVQKSIVADFWGSPDAFDGPNDFKPINEYKIRYAKYCINSNFLHDSLCICNWTWPFVASPLKSRKYKGDIALESKFFSLATGIETSFEELDLASERVFILSRALTILELNTIDLRKEHDVIPEWMFHDHSGKNLPAFTTGCTALDKADMEKTLDMFYAAYGMDVKTGAPTRETLIRLGMQDIADKLASLNLLPPSAAAAK